MEEEDSYYTNLNSSPTDWLSLCVLAFCPLTLSDKESTDFAFGLPGNDTQNTSFGYTTPALPEAVPNQTQYQPSQAQFGQPQPCPYTFHSAKNDTQPYPSPYTFQGTITTPQPNYQPYSPMTDNSWSNQQQVMPSMNQPGMMSPSQGWNTSGPTSPTVPHNNVNSPYGISLTGHNPMMNSMPGGMNAMHGSMNNAMPGSMSNAMGGMNNMNMNMLGGMNQQSPYNPMGSTVMMNEQNWSNRGMGGQGIFAGMGPQGISGMHQPMMGGMPARPSWEYSTLTRMDFMLTSQGGGDEGPSLPDSKRGKKRKPNLCVATSEVCNPWVASLIDS